MEPLKGALHFEALLQNPTLMRLIVDSVNIPINYCSSDLRFLFVNKTYAEWYGREPEEIIGKHLREILGSKGVERIRPYFEQVLRGEQVKYELEVPLSIGQRYLECHYTPVLDGAGKVTGWVGAVYDMTVRNQLEKALQKNEVVLKQAKTRAELANAAKDDFLAHMSHEIRTPLNAVTGLSHILALSHPLTPQQKDFIKTLDSAAHTLLDLVNDLLDTARLNSGSVELEKVPFLLEPMAQEVVNMLNVRAKEKGLKLTLKFDFSLRREFFGDPLRLRQILTNLLGNAIKFTEKGSVDLCLSAFPGDTPDQTGVCMEISDTGIGIEAGKISDIFNKFSQADNTISRRYGGTGLGLSITKTLVEMMGGTIEVKSEVGKGTTFSIRLLLEYAQHGLVKTAEIHAIKAPIPSPVMPHILLVEDYPANVLVATSILENLGVTFETTDNGADAVAKIKQNSYDMVLMDVQMPVMDGFTATRMVRQHENEQGLQPVPIVGITAYALSGDKDRCLNAGMSDYISKPFTEELLQTKIALHASRKKPPLSQAAPA